MERVFGKLLGLAAALLTITLWGSLPVLRNLVHLPPMLTAAVAMATAAVLAQFMAGRNRRAQRGPSLRDPRFWLMGVGGLTGALYFYFLALAEGDPAKVTLVTYTWPIGFILVADRLAGNGLRLRTLWAGVHCLGLCAGAQPVFHAGRADLSGAGDFLGLSDSCRLGIGQRAVTDCSDRHRRQCLYHQLLPGRFGGRPLIPGDIHKFTDRTGIA